jgi:hypothetical protein
VVLLDLLDGLPARPAAGGTVGACSLAPVRRGVGIGVPMPVTMVADDGESTTGLGIGLGIAGDTARAAGLGAPRASSPTPAW